MPDLPPLLDVGHVMDRYAIRDRRTARKLMDATGGAVCVGGRLLVRADALDAWERTQAASRQAATAQVAGGDRERRGAASRDARSASSAGLDRLPRDFWREES